MTVVTGGVGGAKSKRTVGIVNVLLTLVGPADPSANVDAAIVSASPDRLLVYPA